METSVTNPITVGTKVTVTKGCKALQITKYASATIVAVQEMGAEYSHQVKVTLKITSGFLAGTQRTLWVRHINRLGDEIVNLNDGNPLHKVQIRARS